MTSIEKYKGTKNYSFYTKEKLFWGAEKSPDYTNLIGRIFEDANGKILFSKNYVYDEHGNIKQDILSGNLTGNHENGVIIDKNGMPASSNEKYEKNYLYSSDEMNLLVAEWDDFHRIEYTYHPQTDLLASKLFYSSGIIQERHFYDYDENGALICEIEDDGCTNKKDNIQNVTVRRIKKIQNTKAFPIGLPETIEEKYLDQSGEKLLHKIKNKYNSKGQLFEQWHYDSNNKHVYTLSWEYDNQGNIIKETDALGQVTIRDYDKSGNKIFEQGPCPDYYTEYSYDLANRLFQEDKIGKETYTKHFSYDYLGNRTSITDIYGNTTKFKYDDFGRVIKTIFPKVVDENGQHIQLVEIKKYDPFGNVVHLEKTDGTVTKKKFTIHKKPYFIEYPDGSKEKFVYYKNGCLEKKIEKNGSFCTYQYDYKLRPIEHSVFDPHGNKLYTTHITYNVFHKLTESDPMGRITYFKYDKAGRLIEVKKEDCLTRYVYDELGRQKETREYYDENGYLAKIKEHDFLNRVIEERVENENRKILTKVNYGYDSDGNQYQTLTYNDSGTSVTTTSYNSLKEPVSILDAIGNTTLMVYNRSHCNELGQVVPSIETIDPLGQIKITVSDALGRITLIEKKNPFSQLIQKQEFFYDAGGRKARLLETVFVEGKLDKQVTTLWSYDHAGRLKQLTEASGTPEQQSTKYEYNCFGDKEQTILSDGTIIRYSYDSLGRIIEYATSDGTIHYTYRYDWNNNPLQISDEINHLITKKEYNRKDQLIYEKLGNGLEIEFIYDRIGRTSRIIHHDSSGVIYEYDSLWLKHVKRLSHDKKVMYQHTYHDYDLSGQMLHAVLIGQAGELQYEYDLMGRTKKIKTQSFIETIHEFDPVGNLLYRTIEDAEGRQRCKYSYDDLYQLKTEDGMSSNVYVTDSLFNRVENNGRVNKVNSLNQLLDDESYVYDYDKNGRLKIKKSKSGNDDIIFSYDALDRLTEVTKGNIKYHYQYDADNRRLSKTVFESGIQIETIRYVYEGRNEVGACNGQGKWLERRILGKGIGGEIGAAIAIEIAGKAYAPIHDHNGNVISLIDPKKRIVTESYRYSAFGEEQIFNYGETLENPWRFSSKRFDPETRLVYFGQRYYDPAIGRWITKDPCGLEADGPNLYAYVSNNPLILIDEYGLFSLTDGSGLSGLSQYVMTVCSAFHHQNIEDLDSRLC